LGGDSELMYKFMNWYKKHTKKIILIVNGEAISAHANIVCRSKYRMESGSSLIFHSFFTRNKQTRQKQFYDDETRDVLEYCVQRGILTSRDVDRIVYERKRVIVNSDGSKEYKQDYK